MSELYDFDPEAVAHRVYLLRQIGIDWTEIQHDLMRDEYSEERIPIDTLRELLRSYTMQLATYIGPSDREMLLGLELSRLDKLQTALWPAAMQGDRGAAETILKISAQRAKYSGMDQLNGVDKQTLSTILVVGGDQQTFVEALKNGQAQRQLLAGSDLDDEEDYEEGDGE